MKKKKSTYNDNLERKQTGRTAGSRLLCYLPALFFALLLLYILLQAVCRPAIRVSAPSSDLPPAREAHPVVLPAAEESVLPAAKHVRRPDCYTILLCGTDAAGGGSDTNLLLRFDVPLRRMDLVSLPRDTLLHRTWYSNKLNYAYASGGIRLLRSEIENLLGIPVDFYAVLNLQGFIALVDGLGGVDFDIPADMDYDDPAQGLHIHYAAGPQHLNGQQAMEVIRWRKNNNGGGYADADIGRIATQQAFLKALAQKALRLGSIPALSQLFFRHIQTNLSAGNLVWLGTQAAQIGLEGLRFHTLPGRGDGWYRGESVYIPDPEATLALVNEALNPYEQPLTPEELDLPPA